MNQPDDREYQDLIAECHSLIALMHLDCKVNRKKQRQERE